MLRVVYQRMDRDHEILGACDYLAKDFLDKGVYSDIFNELLWYAYYADDNEQNSNLVAIITDESGHSYRLYGITYGYGLFRHFYFHRDLHMHSLRDCFIFDKPAARYKVC